ncbi:MAG: flagellar type III secretion system protein FliR [Campylobacterales bacterium]|nr:flagellar type III secretion system protein FliR [Campylobacterales bacterium]
MEIANFLNDGKVVIFLLLFVRFSAIFAFIPIFSHNAINAEYKAAMAFLMSIIFYPLLPPISIELTWANIMIAILLEGMFGFITGLFLSIVFDILRFAGELIAFVMGFTMASVMDPQTQSQTPITSQILTLIALLFLFAIDGHHIILLFIHESLNQISLGMFHINGDIIDYCMKMMKEYFIVGFSIAFPILALSLLSDILFGMLMKTMPQFNLLVIGFPIKIVLAFMILIVVMSAYMIIFKRVFMEYI